uniref:ParA family protein n=1 Tax=Thermofilum pendens TaxID=2269 RepID=A0A7J3X7M5_THEPE
MIVATFSGSKGGTGKTTLAVCVSVVTSAVMSTLLVDASAEGGATAYLLGDAPPPYLREDPERSLRRVDAEGLKMFIAVNRGALTDVEAVARAVGAWASRFDFVVLDIPALTDVDAVERYMPLLRLADTILVVTEPNPAALEASLYTFGGKRVVVALNSPRPYPKTVVDHYARVVASFCRRASEKGVSADYVLVPYDPAVSRLGPSTFKALNYTSEGFDSAVMQLVVLLLRKK